MNEVLHPHARIYGEPPDTAVIEAIQRQASPDAPADPSASRLPRTGPDGRDNPEACGRCAVITHPGR
jgi:hypothetical protein